MTLNVSGYQSGDAKLLPIFDLGGCSPSVTPGQTYNLGTWYESTGITQFALYYRDSSGAWYYWTSSPWFAPASGWTQATFQTPPAPANATGMSFGLALIANGSLTTDDYSMASTAAASTANMASLNLTAIWAPVSIPAAFLRSYARKPPRTVKGWGAFDRPSLPSGIGVRLGTRVVPAFKSDGTTTTPRHTPPTPGIVAG